LRAKDSELSGHLALRLAQLLILLAETATQNLQTAMTRLNLPNLTQKASASANPLEKHKPNRSSKFAKIKI